MRLRNRFGRLWRKHFCRCRIKMRSLFGCHKFHVCNHFYAVACESEGAICRQAEYDRACHGFPACMVQESPMVQKALVSEICGTDARIKRFCLSQIYDICHKEKRGCRLRLHPCRRFETASCIFYYYTDYSGILTSSAYNTLPSVAMGVSPLRYATKPVLMP